MWIGEAIWLSLAVWGLAAVAERLHLLFTVIKYAGVAYLLYLAWSMWFAPVDLCDGALPQGKSGASSPMKLISAAMAVTPGHPKHTLFYLAPLTAVLHPQQLHTE